MTNAIIKRVSHDWPFLLVLAIQNLTVYWGHYFGRVGFPWDFSMAYYAMVAFWTTAVRQGIFPQWIPFQQMGYPFALQLQSGVNYLPLWIFPALNIPYTLHAAIVLQCLHVLAGGVGMFLLAQRLYPSKSYALVAGIAFQFFGGFYSNAEHVDIIRAFAYAPWLLYVFSLDNMATPDHKITALPIRAMLIPPVLYLFLSGAYPGNVFAGGFIIALFVGLQLLDAYAEKAAPARLIILALSMAGLAILGCGMASLQWGPVWIYRDQFVRAEPLLSMPDETLWLEHLPGLFLSNRTLPGEISMTSMYVSMPILFFATFIPGAAFRRYAVVSILGVIAWLMAAGDRSFLSPIATKLIPILGLSRFPSSDYRVFIAIPVILLSIRGLQGIVAKELSPRNIAIRSAICIVWVLWGLARVYHSVSVTALVVASASLLTILWLWRGPARLTLTGVAIVGLLISVDAVRVLPDILGWNQADINAYYLSRSSPPVSPLGHQLAVARLFHNLPTTRPRRTVPAGPDRWAGYIDGRFLTADLAPNVLQATRLIGLSEINQQYMLKEWSPLLLNSAGTRPGLSQIVVPDAEIARGLNELNAGGGGQVTQVSYGVNDIVYHVSLTAARLLVENEMYFPGWRARLTTRAADVLDAVAVNGVFRSWSLPPGDYTMEAHFELPHLLALRLVSAISFLAWLSAWLAWRKKPLSAMRRQGFRGQSLKAHAASLGQEF